MLKKPVVTTSWDDGHPLDMKLLELLYKYDIKGTFYIPIENDEHPILSKEQIREISQNAEVGCHTYHHYTLTKLSLRDAWEEISSSKVALENLTSCNIDMFCYPKGLYNKDHVQYVKKCGFIGARTCRRFETKYFENPYLMGTTIHIYPRMFFFNLTHMLRRGMYAEVIQYIDFCGSESDIMKMTERYLSFVLTHGGVLHIWGHSWEIEENCLWKKLEKIISLINQSKLLPKTNSEIIRINIQKEAVQDASDC